MDKTYNINGGYKPSTKRFADINGPDFFPTPEWATEALIDNEIFEGDIWECACGNGSMAEILKKTGNKIISSDLYDRGYGEPHINFLDSSSIIDNIITNPPFNSAEGFVKKGLELSKKKFALLLRLAFLEGINRQKTIFSITPPARVWVFSERITFYPEGSEQRGNGTTAYAWFIWDKQCHNTTELKWIEPKYKKKSNTKKNRLLCQRELAFF